VRHTTRWIALSVAVVVLLLGVMLATLVGGDPEAERARSQLLNDRVPAFSVRTPDGEDISGADLDGRAVIVNFWNSWCLPCHQELPALTTFYERHADDPEFLMLGIVRDDTERAVRSYMTEQGIEWTIGFDPDADAALAFGTRGQPETFAITPDGVIVGYQYGPSTVAHLERLLERAKQGSA
jgi:cytochrome c biogenesis protein CcmG/thiol:disulfide interchange protein DsbE